MRSIRIIALIRRFSHPRSSSWPKRRRPNRMNSRCQSLLNDAQKQYAAGNSDNLVKVIGSGQAKCPGVSALSSKAADMVFKEGLEIYKKSQMTEALQKFRTALVLDPSHDLAAQYVDLTERKLEFTADRALIAWRKDFDAGEFALAAGDYRELASLKNSNEIDSIQAEYRRALSSHLDSWNRACATDDIPTMERLRLQAAAMLPYPSFGEDILAKMENLRARRMSSNGKPLGFDTIEESSGPSVFSPGDFQAQGSSADSPRQSQNRREWECRQQRNPRW